jgi:DNA-binding transcriptional LysR family regulator
MDSSAWDLNLLTALDALLTELNVTKAAKRLKISQPALSGRLAKLRSLFGDALLIPTQRGMVPTQRALDLQEPLRRALEQLRSVVRTGERFDPSTSRQTISIAASDYMQATLILPLLPAIRRQAPLLRIAVHLIDGGRIWEQMEHGDVDIALMTPETAPPLLRSRPLWNERYVCIARVGHTRARRAADPASFASLDHVVVSPRGSGFTGPADAVLKAQGLVRNVVLSVNSFLLVPEIVASSNLVALVPERLVAGHKERLQIFEPPIAVPGFSISMVWHERTMATQSHIWLRKKIGEEASAA